MCIVSLLHMAKRQSTANHQMLKIKAILDLDCSKHLILVKTLPNFHPQNSPVCSEETFKECGCDVRYGLSVRVMDFAVTRTGSTARSIRIRFRTDSGKLGRMDSAVSSCR